MKLNFNVQNPSFTAGKVKLYSDFDGTYFPSSRSTLRKGEDVDLMKNYSSKMDKFFKSTKGDLDFHITTGRDFESFKSVSEFLKEKGLSLPYPQSFITSNGSCEYIKSIDNTSSDFPFSTKIVNTSKIKGDSKLVDTAKALENVLKENDLLIVAGNSKNDLKMLNPLEYIKQEEWDAFKLKNTNKKFYESSMTEKMSMLKDVYNGKNTELKKQLELDGLLKKIEDLPLRSIVVESDKPEIKMFIDSFENSGKIIKIAKGDLDSGIKSAVKSYAQKNNSYKNSMSKDFLNVIFQSNSMKTFNAILLPITGILLTGFVMAKHYLHPEKKLNKKTA